MKRLVTIMAAMSVASLATANDTTWGWDANTRIRHEMHSNPAGTEGGSLTTEDYSFTEQKTTLGLNFNKGDKFKGAISLIHAFNWGDNGAGNFDGEFNSPSGGGTVGHPNGIDDQQNLLLVNEAWLWWGFNDSFSAAAGRGGIEVADGKVISTNSDEITPNAFEGLRLMYDHAMVTTTGYLIKVSDVFNAREQEATPGTGGEFTNDPGTELLGLTFDVKGMPEFLKMFNIHVFQVNSDGVGGPSSNFMTIGAALGGAIIPGLSYTANYVTQSGEESDTVDSSGSMYDVSLKYSMPEMMGFWVMAGMHSDSGDDGNSDDEDEGYQALFYNRHNNAGLMDVLEWGNLTYTQFGVGMTAMDIAFAVNYYMFKLTDDTSGVTVGKNGNFLTSGGAPAGEDNIGSELDITASGKCPVTGLNLGVRYGMFMPGDLFVDPNAETYSQLVFEAGMDF